MFNVCVRSMRLNFVTVQMNFLCFLFFFSLSLSVLFVHIIEMLAVEMGKGKSKEKSCLLQTKPKI